MNTLRKTLNTGIHIFQEHTVAVYYVANIIDAIITLYCVRHGLAEEGNPIMRQALDYPLLFLAIKTIIPLAVCTILNKRGQKWFMYCCAAVMIGIVVWNIAVVGYYWVYYLRLMIPIWIKWH